MEKLKCNICSSDYSFRKVIVTICTLLLLNFFCYSQSIIITGAVKDTLNAPVVNASITFINNTGTVLFYTFSNSKGFFKLQVTDKTKASQITYIQITAFGYTSQKQEIKPDKETYNFILSANYKEMEAVKVAGMQKVKTSGDTTSYNVNAFAGKEDRSIGNVISKLPGMTVSENGKIKYKDKEIAGLYIQGDNLLESNYGIGTNAISKEMIKSIQVIEKFQPIRVLQDKVLTNDVAINLVLKDPNALTLSGQADAGIGIRNIIQADVASMLFNKKVKTLNIAKYNNSGETFVDEKFDDLLYDGAIDNPGIPERYINNNRSALASSNYLYNFKDTLQLKANIQYTTDQNILDYVSYNKNYLANDTVVYNEQQHVVRKPRVFFASLTLEQNKKSGYLKDDFTIKSARNRSLSFMDFNSDPLNQNFNSSNKDVLNNLQLIPSSKKRNYFSINWRLDYNEIPQNLLVQPGIDTVELNNGIPYNAVFQGVDKRIFKSKLVFNYYLPTKKILKKSIQIGIDNEFQKLDSRISLTQNDGTKNFYTGDDGNNLKWQRHREYIAAGFVINTPYLKFNLSVPLVFQQILFSDKSYVQNKSDRQLFVNPRLGISYFFNSQHSVNFNYSDINNFGSVNDVYGGAILINFKELGSNSSNIMETKQRKLNLYYSYSNHVKMLDFTVGGQYTATKNNSIYSTIYERSIMKTVLLPYRNVQSGLSYNALLSKYFFSIKSKFEIEYQYSDLHTDLFANNSFLPYSNKNLKMRLTGGTSLSEYVSLYYTGVANWFESKPRINTVSNTNEKSKIYNHTYSLIISPKIPVNIICQAQQQVNVFKNLPDTRFFFANFIVRYKAAKLRTEFEMEADNIFNVKEFGTYYLSTNQSFSSTYQLRGRMILFKANFIF